MEKLSEDELEVIRKDPVVRKTIAEKSHLWFFCLYLKHYIQFHFASLHHKMLEITESQNIKFAGIVAFRGSGKSTIMTLSYPIWAITGILKKKFVLIVSQTQNQAKLHLENIKRELETNKRLKDDVGPFDEPKDEWSANSIIIPKFDARITAVSTEQSIRGIRHGQYRPDLIICDDIEDLNSVKTKEGREKTNSWWNGEIIPVGDKNTKIVVVGNLLHEDSLLMKFKKQIEEKRLIGSFSEFPLIDKNGKIAWPERYPTMKDIENLKASFTLESAYFREYLLKIISDAGRVVLREWVHYYDELPDRKDLRFIATGIDLAISEKASADYTAMVSAYIYGYGDDLKIYILPNPVNERMDFPTTLERAKNLSKVLGGGQFTKLFIENGGYQDSLIQQLQAEGFPAEPFSPKGQDKTARLSLTTHLIKSGKILFPRHKAEDLIEQLVGFRIEKHDDLVDAFSILVLSIISDQSYDFQNIIDINMKPISPFGDILSKAEPIFTNPESQGWTS